MMPYEPPGFQKEAFNCPHCQAYAHQEWRHTYPSYHALSPMEGLMTSECSHCKKICIWYEKKMIYPRESGVPLPHEDLPEEIKKDYEEARSILNNSPRGAVALLRLAIQKLMVHLGESGENLNSDIANLVKKGLPVEIQQALDVVRVIGNNAVHPGQIDISDDTETATQLFNLINFITERMITQPKEIEKMFKRLPESQKEQIKKRDEK